MPEPNLAPSSIEELRLIFRRAGLEPSDADLEKLQKMQGIVAEQIKLLHDPTLPLAEPAATFRAAWQ